MSDLKEAKCCDPKGSWGYWQGLWSQGYLCMTLVFCLFIPILAYKCFWADSELWAVFSARKLFETPEGFDFNIKPFFNYLLYWISLIPSDHHFVSVPRLVFSFVALAVVFLTYKVSLLVHGSKVKASLSILLLVSSSFYLQRSFRVRSDILVTFIYLINFYLQYKLIGRWPKLFAGGILGVISLGITPKSIILFLSFIPFILMDKNFLTVISERKKFGLSAILMSLAFIAILLLLHGIIYQESLVKSLNYFIDTFNSLGVGPSYWNWIRFYYVLNFFSVNIHITILLLASLVYSLIYMKRLDRLSIFFAILGTGFFFYPSRFPFYIASLLPFLCLYIVRSKLVDVMIFSSRKWVSHVALTVILCFSVWNGFWQTSYILNHHTNSLQLEATRRIERYLSYLPSGYRVYDPLGVVPNIDSFNWFVGQGERENNKNVVKYIGDSHIDIVLYVHRLAFLEPQLSQMLDREFLPLGRGIYVRSIGFRTDKEILKSGLPKKKVKDLLSLHYSRFYRDENVYLVGYNSSGHLIHRFQAEFGNGQSGNIRIPQSVFYIKATVFGGKIPIIGSNLRDLYKFDSNL